MKISIGINGFKQFADLEKREKFCLESLIKCKTDNIELYNLIFCEEEINYEQFKTLKCLTKKSNEVIKRYFSQEGLQQEYNLKKDEIDLNTKQKPSVKEIFDNLANLNTDYFLFLNNDIILSNRLFKNIDTTVDCYAISRMHIYDIQSLNSIPTLESYSVHGFDAFLIKTKTWKKICNNFPDLILGCFYWDTFFATMFKLLCKTEFYNDIPPVCFHIEHNSVSSHSTIENYYNEDNFKRNLLVSNMWFNYVQNILLKRETLNNCKWYKALPDEKNTEQKYFDQFKQCPTYFSVNFVPEQIKTNKQTKVDLFIPVAPKDEIKLQYVIEYANKHLLYNKMYICSPHIIQNKIKDSNIFYLNDRDVLDVPDRNFISFRPNWIYQQFLKMFFDKGESDYYFVLDSDTIILKHLKFFDDNCKPIWYFGWNQNHFPYFHFNKNVFNLNKSLTHTGIGDLGLFNKNITSNFLKYTKCNSSLDLLNKIGSLMNVVFHFSEYETYSNFVNTYYPNLYTFRQISQKNQGKDLNIGESWNTEEIFNVIKGNQNSSYDTLSLHSWKL